MNDLVHTLLAPLHLSLDAILLIGFLSWVYFLEEVSLLVKGKSNHLNHCESI
tara:strand:- start:251 stop:406 length:156 start_codon:yes stop_codon:yes gene_type:complete